MRSTAYCTRGLMSQPSEQSGTGSSSLRAPVLKGGTRPSVLLLCTMLCAVIMTAGCRSQEYFFDVTGELSVVSASQHYDEAVGRARAWMPDVTVASVSAAVVSSNTTGTVPSLTYRFGAPSVPDSLYALDLEEYDWISRVVELGSSAAAPRPIERDDWTLDSVDAWSIALANGVEAFLVHYQEPGTLMDVTLDYWPTEIGHEVLAWRVHCLVLYGPSLYILIDPKSGGIIDIEERSVSGTLVATTPTLPPTPWAPLPVCTPATPEPARATGLAERIAFESSRDGPLHIYVMDPDGSNIVQLTDGPGADTNAAWSPDGQRIAFTNTSGLNIDIYVVDADGANLQRLTDDPAYDREPSWSPDGRHIAFSSDRDGNENLYIMGSDGSNLSLLTDHPSEDQSPAWSPDGCRIAFVSSRDHWPEAHIYVMNVDGSNVTQLTSGSTLDYGPRWSPDGTRIAFSSQPISVTESQANVYVMDQDGSHQVRLTTGFCGGFRPVWSPDGERIAFATGRDDPFGSDIFVMDADGSNVVQLTYEPEDNWPSSWR
jgi:Tol biopolymer transport system component